MINGQYHTERTYKRRRIIIDLCMLPGYDYKYEVMAMYANGLDFDCKRFNELSDAVTAYNDMLDKYQDKPDDPPAPLSGKYAKLRDDLKAALIVAKAAEGDDDGGTCNLDGCGVMLPRWRESLVKQAAEEDGTTVFTWNLYGGRKYVFSPQTNGQGTKRARAADAMVRYMTAAGYDALTYCQMD